MGFSAVSWHRFPSNKQRFPLVPGPPGEILKGIFHDGSMGRLVFFAY